MPFGGRIAFARCGVAESIGGGVEILLDLLTTRVEQTGKLVADVVAVSRADWAKMVLGLPSLLGLLVLGSAVLGEFDAVCYSRWAG